MIGTKDAVRVWDESPAGCGPAILPLSSCEVYRNKWLRVRENLPSNGQHGIYGVVDKHPGAITLPIDRGRVWLVE